MNYIQGGASAELQLVLFLDSYISWPHDRKILESLWKGRLSVHCGKAESQ
jgi:hypothetical protein